MQRTLYIAWVLAVALLTPVASQAAESGKSLGFVFTYFWYDLYQGDDACPDGPALGAAEYSMLKLPKAERTTGPIQGEGKLLTKLRNLAWKGHTTSETTQGILPDDPHPRKNNFPAGTPGPIDRCYHPADYTDPPHRLVSGPTALGMHLEQSDGQAANTCAHEPFTSPSGEHGIDNQFYRVIGCINSYRSKGTYRPLYSNEYQDRQRKEGHTTTLLEVTGYEEGRNDYDVWVGLYSSKNPTRYDGSGKGLSYVSYTINDDARWQTRVRGHIKDGVLTTEPTDLRLHGVHSHDVGEFAEWYIRGARLRLELQPDGTAKGELGGYGDIDTLFNLEFGGYHASIAESVYGFTCPAVYAAMKEHADGYPDPTTGKCTAISMALKIDAVPAFVFHPLDEPKKVARDSGR